MGWNSKSGILKNEKISEDELWSYFNYFFSDSCSKTTPYPVNTYPLKTDIKFLITIYLKSLQKVFGIWL